MANLQTPFFGKNGLGTSNVLVIDTSQNLTNVGSANMVSLNVSSNIANVGNVAVTQNLVAGNISTTNLTVTNPIAQFANNGVYVAGTLIANNPNINFVAANTSNLLITGTSNTSPGNVTITLDTRSACWWWTGWSTSRTKSLCAVQCRRHDDRICQSSHERVAEYALC